MIGVFIIYLLLINKIGIDVRTSMKLSITGIGIYMIWLLGTEGGKRWMERVGEGYFSSIWYEIMRYPEGDLLPPRYEILRLSFINRGFIGLLMLYVILRNVMRNMGWILDERLIKIILVLGNTVSIIYVMVMLLKTFVMGREYMMKIMRGDYVMSRPQGGLSNSGPGGNKPNRRFMWKQAAKGAGRVTYPGGKALVAGLAGGASVGMSLDWYGENVGKGKIGSNALREGLRSLGVKGIPAPHNYEDIIRGSRNGPNSYGP